MDNYWKKNKTLGSAVNNLFDNQLMSDIKFTFESDVTKTLYAHSYELAKRSEVFYKKFSETFNISKLIPINNYSYEIFYEFIKFFYYDDCKIEKKNAAQLLKLSKEYKVILLEEKASNFISKNLSIDNVCDIFDNAINEGFKDLKFRVIGFFNRNYVQVIKHPNFLKVQQKTLLEILKIDMVDAKNEMVICDRAMDWAKKKCEENCYPCDGPHMRQVLGDALFQIRFPTMTSENFGTFLSKHPGVLSADETSGIFINISVRTKNTFGFSDTPRKMYVKLPKVENINIKADERSSSKDKGERNKKQDLKILPLHHLSYRPNVLNSVVRSIFTVSHQISLVAVSLWGVLQNEFTYDLNTICISLICLEKFKANKFNNLINGFKAERKCLSKENPTTTYYVTFNEPIHLYANSKYQLVSHYQNYTGMIRSSSITSPYFLNSEKLKLNILEGDIAISDLHYQNK